MKEDIGWNDDRHLPLFFSEHIEVAQYVGQLVMNRIPA
jgi:hypothetical protein